MLLFADSFSHYATADLTKKWTSGNAVINATAGRRGGGAMNIAATGSVSKTLASAISAFVVGFAFSFVALPGTARAIFTTYDAGTAQIILQHNLDGTFSVYRNTVLLSTSTYAASAGSFVYLELKATINDTTGSYVLRANGINILSATNVDTKNTANATINSFEFDRFSGGAAWTITDLYFCDQSGTTNNDFLGDIRVDTLYPNADGTYSQFTPSAANGAHRYWRLYITATADGSTSGSVYLNELVLSLTPGGASVATGGTPSASSVFGGAAANAFDGNGNTMWGATPQPAWIAYDFGAGNAKDIRGFKVSSRIDGAALTQSPRDFQLQYSDDNSAWTSLAIVVQETVWAASETKSYLADLTGMTHAGLVDERAPNTTDYNYALTPGLRDSYAFQDLPSLVSSTVYGVQVNAALLKDDAGNKQVALFTKTGAENTDGATFALGTSQTYVSQIFERNLNGTTDWTQASVNAAEFGAKVVV